MPNPSDPGGPPPEGRPDPPPPEGRPAHPPPEGRPAPPPPGSAEEALRRLEQRLDRATEATERLMAQAAEAAAGAAAANPARGNSPSDEPSAGTPSDGEPGEPVKPPPAGWQIPDDGPAGIRPDLDPFIALVQALRDLIPPELQRRLVAALRELLLALRALIDWYLEHLERRRGQSVEVQDIPIL